MSMLEVARARSAERDLGTQAPTFRAETLRRFANVVRNRQIAALADLIARETGKPLWEAETEVALGHRQGRHLDPRL